MSRTNYNRQHVASGTVISGSSDGQLTVGDLRDAIAELPDDAEVIFGTCDHGDPLKFHRFKMRGEDILSIEFGWWKSQVKKAECEKAIRHLCGVWAGERNLPHRPDDPDFGDFYQWLRSRAPQYLDFRTTEGVRDAVEHWFAQEFRQTWRY